jgi:adenosine kinase
MVEALIITKGGQGSEIYTNNEVLKIAPTKADAVQDPTGCGDAYRAGLLYGIMNNMSWKVTGQLAGLLGAIKVAHLGTQNHHFDLNEIKQKYQTQYGEGLL